MAEGACAPLHLAVWLVLAWAAKGTELLFPGPCVHITIASPIQALKMMTGCHAHRRSWAATSPSTSCASTGGAAGPGWRAVWTHPTRGSPRRWVSSQSLVKDPTGPMQQLCLSGVGWAQRMAKNPLVAACTEASSLRLGALCHGAGSTQVCCSCTWVCCASQDQEPYTTTCCLAGAVSKGGAGSHAGLCLSELYSGDSLLHEHVLPKELWPWINAATSCSTSTSLLYEQTPSCAIMPCGAGACACTHGAPDGQRPRPS